LKPALIVSAVAAALATASLGAHAQDAAQTAPPQQPPAPIVRPHKPAAAATPYQQSFPVTYGATGPQRITLPQAAPKPATPPARITGATAATGTQSTVHPITLHPAEPTTASTPTAPSAPVPLPALAFNRTTIVLDPAHGGADSGSRISDTLLEKDVDLAFAFKLRSLLQARGFNVVLTRDADAATAPNNPGEQLTLDDRAGIANHERAVACLLLHATSAGSGVHLYHSELIPTPGEPASASWLTAQAPWVPQSQALSQSLAQAINRAGIPLVASAASVRPLDSLTCPALVVELAPKNGDSSTLSNDSYQQSVAQAIASALVFWKNQAQPPSRLQAQTSTPPTLPPTAPPHPKPRPAAVTTPKPKPAPAPATPEDTQ
jgi:N-acetylmuramoyl-L-alanine amidase